DRAVLDGAQLRRRDLSPGGLVAGLEQVARAQEAADVVGAERRGGAGGHRRVLGTRVLRENRSVARIPRTRPVTLGARAAPGHDTREEERRAPRLAAIRRHRQALLAVRREVEGARTARAGGAAAAGPDRLQRAAERRSE